MPSNGRFKFGVRCKFYFGEGEHEVQWVWKGGEGTEKRGPSQPRSSRILQVEGREVIIAYLRNFE